MSWNPALVPMACGNTQTSTATNQGTGHAGRKDGKQKALDRARDDADAKNQAEIDAVECPSDCQPIDPASDPPYDSSTPTYTPFGKGWECTVNRSVTVTFSCPARKAAGAGGAGGAQHGGSEHGEKEHHSTGGKKKGG